MNLSKEEILEAFKNVEGAISEYEALQQELDAMEKPYNTQHAQIDVVPPWFKVAGVMIGFFVSFWTSGIILVVIGSDTSTKALIGFGAGIGLSVLLYKFAKKLYINSPQNLKRKQNLKEMEDRATEIFDQMKQLIYMIQIYCPFLSEDYCEPVAIRTMRGYLYAGRAHDLESMINLYELEAHRERMEMAQKKLLQEQQYQTSVLQQLEDAHTSALGRIFKNM